MLNSLYSSNLLKYKLTNSIIPPSVPIKLNTYYLSKILPHLYKEYPNKDFFLVFTIVNSPVVAFDEKSQNIGAKLILQVDLALEENPTIVIFAFKTSIAVDLTTEPQFYEGKVHIQIKDIDFSNLEVVVSCEHFDPKTFEGMLNLLSSTAANYVNSQILDKGIDIPTIQGMKISHLMLDISKDFIEIGVEPDFESSDFSWLN